MLTKITLSVDAVMLQTLQMGLGALKSAAAQAEAELTSQVQAALEADAAASAAPREMKAPSKTGNGAAHASKEQPQ